MTLRAPRVESDAVNTESGVAGPVRQGANTTLPASPGEERLHISNRRSGDRPSHKRPGETDKPPKSGVPLRHSNEPYAERRCQNRVRHSSR